MAYIYSKNNVREAIKNNNAKEVFCTESNVELINLAKQKGVSLKLVENKDIDRIVGKVKHQGICAKISEYKYATLEEILDNKKQYPFIVMLDGIEDPHNLGAIMRTCDAAGVDGIIIGKNRSVRLTDTVACVSTGAIEYVKTCAVTNLTNTIRTLKKQGFWIVGAEVSDNSIKYNTMKYDMPVCLVVGSEGHGISSLVKQNCDVLVEIPMQGHVNSLNVSVSCSILIYEIIKYH
ncbi:MAG: 23S rRNA (guanosine(2251)-2'-O)-methyltransferase RlmB [Bacilli bacterium]